MLTSEYHDSNTYNYLFYYSVKDGSAINLFGLDIHRNAGIFWEPGILQIYLNILFFLEVSVFKRNKSLLALIIIGILSYSSNKIIPTYSTDNEIKCFDFYYNYDNKIYINGKLI